jgi:hypothetical protein
VRGPTAEIPREGLQNAEQMKIKSTAIVNGATGSDFIK